MDSKSISQRPLPALKTLLLLLMLLLPSMDFVESDPIPSRRSYYGNLNTLSNVYSFISRESRQASSSCFADPRKQYACEMCAKLTRSLYVFKQCCISQTSTFRWCKKFLAYGIN